MRWSASQTFRSWRMCLAAAVISVPAASVFAEPAGSVDTLALELEYKVFIRGIRVGAARIRAETGDGRYRLCGRMHTTDIWARLAPWEATFRCPRPYRGDGRGCRKRFACMNARGRKRKGLSTSPRVCCARLRDGERQEDQPAPDGVDIMSFFWVTARCDAELVLNNGRKSYAMALRERTPRRRRRGTVRLRVPGQGRRSGRRQGQEDVARAVRDRRPPRSPGAGGPSTMPGSLPRRLKLVGASIVENAARTPGGCLFGACPDR